MRVCFDIAHDRAQLVLALELLCALDERQLRRRSLPPLYQSGVRYRPERRGVDEWLQAHQVLRRGVGDCEDLTGWRVAELRLGEDRGARPDCYRVGGRRWHALVLRSDGSYEDPSRILGMGRRRAR